MSIDFKTILSEHAQAVACVESAIPEIESISKKIASVFEKKGCVFICGNGGSASDAQHFAAELTGRYQMDRPGYPAIALTTDCSALTSIGNDYGFDYVFSRQLEALASPGDLLIAISTSGNSANVVKAVEQARHQNVDSIGLLGREGGQLKDLVDTAIVVNVPSTARVQEAHIFILHLLCEAFEPTR